jgi:hypothetical protein
VITLAVVVTAGKKMQDTMNKRLKLEIKKYNTKKYNSNRIILRTLKPNCDNSQKRSK